MYMVLFELHYNHVYCLNEFLVWPTLYVVMLLLSCVGVVNSNILKFAVSFIHSHSWISLSYLASSKFPSPDSSKLISTSAAPFSFCSLLLPPANSLRFFLSFYQLMNGKTIFGGRSYSFFHYFSTCILWKV